MTEFTPVSGLIGGLLIGLASVLMLLGDGRITGISGILAGLLPPTRGDAGWRAMFLGGLVLGAAGWPLVTGLPLPVELQVGWPLMLAAGFIVGFGTRLGSGCTSGHGVCGIGRLAPRSIVATAVFMASGFATTFFIRHLLGG